MLDRRPKPTIRPMIVTCHRCGHEYEASADTIRAGTWRCCPVCPPPRQDDDAPIAA